MTTMTFVARPNLVLFDLDGTLVDSAEDLLAALSHVRRTLGLTEPTPAQAGAFVSAGAAAMLKAGLPEHYHPQIPSLRQSFLDYYEANICQHTRAYPGIIKLLALLRALGIPWAIVTNKPEGLARKLMSLLCANEPLLAPAALLGGDSLAQKKPDPAPLLHISANLKVDISKVWMIGDDPRDIEAGRRAGCAVNIACAYGYLGDAPAIDSWQADLVVQSPQQIIDLIQS